MSHIEMLEIMQEQERKCQQQTPPVNVPAGASKYITITVAEYHFLTKAAAILELIVNDETYDHTAVVNAAKAAIEKMQNAAGAGGKE